MIEMKAMAKGEGDWGWRGIMAGNLYSSLGEAARRDVNLDRAGDFFMARLFNSAKRAEGDWKGKWDREPYDEICQAADLKVAPFFMMVLTDIKKKLRSTDKKTYKSEFDKFCSHAGIKGVKIEEETDKVVGASFERANMAALLFGEGDGWKIALPANVFTMAQLDIADAENVRKLIFNPDGLLQKPNLGILDRKINAVFKHLKGEERAKWFEDMVVAVVNYYLDRSFPAFEGLPSQLRSSISKRDFPDVNPWAWQLAKAQIEAMSPALNRENVFSAFRRTIGPGWRAKIYGRKTLEVVGGGAVDTIKAIFKEMLGLK